MPSRQLPPPSLEERFCAAAYTILSDGRRHSAAAQSWALRFLHRAAGNRPTAFQRQAAQRLASH